jgi:hypothetical protein
MFRKGLVIFAVLCLGGGAFAGYAYSTSRDDAPASHDFRATGTVDKAYTIQASSAPQTITSTGFTSLTLDTIQVPASGQFRVLVRFSAESHCAAVSFCSARVGVDHVEANPKVGTDFAFDSPGGEAFKSASMDRTSDIITGTGNVRNVDVEVSVAVVGGGSWRLDDWTVTAELIKATA